MIETITAQAPVTIDLLWWITAFELPCFAGLFWMIWRSKAEFQQSYSRLFSGVENRAAQLRESMHAHKLEVARTYACHTDLRDLDNRVIAHLLRIEAKLDKTALKTESLKALHKT